MQKDEDTGKARCKNLLLPGESSNNTLISGNTTHENSF